MIIKIKSEREREREIARHFTKSRRWRYQKERNEEKVCVNKDEKV